MDYEKKYKEALERARQLYDSATNIGDIVGCDLESIFPELAESEDERIRRKMIEHFKAKTKETWCNMPVKDIIAYLEKQKEQEPISFNVPFNPDDYEVIMQGNATGLKLKENPKSADSIPSDCTSDAKCEDRWHKVADSMPDNPREVLCKDEAGNYFIGRYYTGEGWEISNYDDEDKPHHLNPPVSKWIDFPSEKQKEPKPAWSEEDEKMKERLITRLNWITYNTRTDGTSPNITFFDEIDWLKSLRPSWKPSEMNTNCQGCLYWTGKCKLPKGLQCPERKEEKK